MEEKGLFAPPDARRHQTGIYKERKKELHSTEIERSSALFNLFDS